MHWHGWPSSYGGPVSRYAHGSFIIYFRNCTLCIQCAAIENWKLIGLVTKPDWSSLLLAIGLAVHLNQVTSSKMRNWTTERGLLLVSTRIPKWTLFIICNVPHHHSHIEQAMHTLTPDLIILMWNRKLYRCLYVCQTSAWLASISGAWGPFSTRYCASLSATGAVCHSYSNPVCWFHACTPCAVVFIFSGFERLCKELILPYHMLLQVRIIYDVSTLSFVRLWVNMIYNAPLVNSEVDAGRVIVSVLGTPENTSLAQVTSDNLHVMTSVFQVRQIQAALVCVRIIVYIVCL